MSSLPPLPLWADIVTSLLLLVGAGLTLAGTIGLVRFKTFYERVHAPTLGATLGMMCILVASMLFFSLSHTRPVVHEVLIGTFITVTTPIVLLMLVRAALHRDRLAGRDPTALRTREPMPEESPDTRDTDEKAADHAELSSDVTDAETSALQETPSPARS